MGNANPCLRGANGPAATLIAHGGATRHLTGRHLAGELMFEFPDHVVYHADSFFIGLPVPSLAIDDELLAGHTYFLLPLDRLPPHGILSASSLAALAGTDPNSKRSPLTAFKECPPFEYVKGSDGRVLIRVLPAFFTRLIVLGGPEASDGADSGGFLCSTPEVRKHYSQLVGSREQIWSPKLETISEHKIRSGRSPCRFIGFEWKHKEIES